MRFILIFLLFPTILYADQGVNISCVNMKNLLDKNPRIHKFKFDVDCPLPYLNNNTIRNLQNIFQYLENNEGKTK